MGRLWAGFWHPSRAKWAFWEGAERAECAERARRGGSGERPTGLLEPSVGRLDWKNLKNWKRLGKSDTPCTRAKPRGRRIQVRCRAKPATALEQVGGLKRGRADLQI